MKAIEKWVRVAGFLLLAAAGPVFLWGCSQSENGGSGAISGEVIAPENSTAPVYILAVAFDNAGMIRRIETEAAPCRSVYVASYTRLESPGPFTITGLRDATMSSGPGWIKTGMAPWSTKISPNREDLKNKILEASYGTFAFYDFDEVFAR